MTPKQDLETRVERWLKEDVPAMPDSLRASVRQQVALKPQRRGGLLEVDLGWGRRWSIGLRLAVAAALATLLVLGAFAFGSRPEPTPTPTAESPSASPAQTATELPVATAVADPFTGTWSTIDGDGSVMLAAFQGTGTSRRVTVTDLRATICGGNTDVFEATGTVDGPKIQMVGSSGCLGGPLERPGEATYTWDAASGTLRSPIEWPGVTEFAWVRASLIDAFDGTWTATDIDGSTMTLTFTGSGLAREVSFHDDRAVPATCPRSGPYSGTGTATIGSVSGDGRFIRISIHGACDSGESAADYVQKFEFVLASNTLLGPLDALEVGGTPSPITVTWHRP